MADKKPVRFSVKNGIAVLALDDPPANAYTYRMMRDLNNAVLQARFKDDGHAVVLRGAGERFFAAGVNMSMLNEVAPRFKHYSCLHANETLNRLEQTPGLVIAALNRHAALLPPIW